MSTTDFIPLQTRATLTSHQMITQCLNSFKYGIDHQSAYFYLFIIIIYIGADMIPLSYFTQKDPPPPPPPHFYVATPPGHPLYDPLKRRNIFPLEICFVLTTSYSPGTTA